jgi:hypothetical protein
MSEEDKISNEASKEDLEKALYERVQDIPTIMNMFHSIRDSEKGKKDE